MEVELPKLSSQSLPISLQPAHLTGNAAVQQQRAHASILGTATVVRTVLVQPKSSSLWTLGRVSFLSPEVTWSRWVCLISSSKASSLSIEGWASQHILPGRFSHGISYFSCFHTLSPTFQIFHSPGHFILLYTDVLHKVYGEHSASL